MADARVWVVTFRLASGSNGYVVPIGAFTTKDKMIDFIIEFLESIRDEYRIDMPTKEYLLENDRFCFSNLAGHSHRIRYYELALDPASKQKEVKHD